MRFDNLLNAFDFKSSARCDAVYATNATMTDAEKTQRVLQAQNCRNMSAQNREQAWRDLAILGGAALGLFILVKAIRG